MEATRISLRQKLLLVLLAAIVALGLSPIGRSYAYTDGSDDDAAASQTAEATETATEAVVADEAGEEADAAALDDSDDLDAAAVDEDDLEALAGSDAVEVIIGTGTTSAKGSNSVPYMFYYNNAVTQSVYLSSEIASEGDPIDSGTITALSRLLRH